MSAIGRASGLSRPPAESSHPVEGVFIQLQLTAEGRQLLPRARAALEAAGFDTAGLRDERLSVGPVFLRPIIVGLARPRTALAEASPAG